VRKTLEIAIVMTVNFSGGKTIRLGYRNVVAGDG